MKRGNNEGSIFYNKARNKWNAQYKIKEDGKIISNERSSKGDKRNDKASRGFTKKINITNKNEIYDNRDGNKLINNNDDITNNKINYELNNALLSLLLNSNNKVT